MKINLDKIKMEEKTYKLINDLYENVSEVISNVINEKLATDTGFATAFIFTVRHHCDETNITVEDCTYYPDRGYGPYEVNVQIEE